MVQHSNAIFLNSNKESKDIIINFIGQSATKSLLAEVSTTPKPGLVDRISNGAHNDMNYKTFIDSANAISPYFFKMAELGYDWEDSLPELFLAIRVVGIEAENAMYVATNHVNTHKGLIFSAGIISAAAAYVYRKFGVFDTKIIFKICTRMTFDIIENDFKKIDSKHPKTNGEKLYLKHRNKGIRGEVQSGFPTVENISLPALKYYRKLNCNKNLSHIQVLMLLIANVDDTNVLARHNKATLDFVKETAKSFLNKGGVFSENGIASIWNMDDMFIQKNISSGGCADLLAITIMIYDLSKGIPK
ncbi:MAG: triphosphoribosyl-dephospho-CoA synthase CitG [Lachnotalea sp.]